MGDALETACVKGFHVDVCESRQSKKIVEQNGMFTFKTTLSRIYFKCISLLHAEL